MSPVIVETVTDGVSDRPVSVLTDPPLPGCSYPASGIDDIYICGQYTPLDGINGTLAAAGPEYVRFPSYLPITGFMLFDSADIVQLKLDNDLAGTIEHEM
jgi:hypothetical protein